MGDFTGFKFNGLHSDDLGLVRVSDRDRYNERLFPDFEDKTIEIPGNDGSYYYGSYFKEKKFEISAAFDHLTEKQFKNLRRIFGNRNISTLIFDEEPYKAYQVKIESPPEINYVCFEERKREIGEEQPNSGLIVEDRIPIEETEEIEVIDEETGEPVIDEETGEPVTETITVIKGYELKRQSITPYVYPGGTERIYKGEIDLSFVAYNPFAIAPFKDRDSYEGEYQNINEWIEAAGLKTTEELQEYDKYIVNQEAQPVSKIIKVYNPGDLPTPFKLYIPFDQGNSIPEFDFGLADATGQMGLKAIERLEKDTEATGVGLILRII